MKQLARILIYAVVLTVTYTIGRFYQMFRDAIKIGSLFKSEEGRRLIRYQANIEENLADGTMSQGEYDLRMRNLNEDYRKFHTS